MNSTKFLLFAFIFSALTVTGCKKDYTCTCTGPAGTVIAFTGKDTHKSASKKCDDYYNQNYGSIPFNTTTCDLK